MCSQRVFELFVLLLVYDLLWLAAACPRRGNNNNQNQNQNQQRQAQRNRLKRDVALYPDEAPCNIENEQFSGDPIRKLGFDFNKNQVYRRVKRESGLRGRISSFYDWATGSGSGSGKTSEKKEEKMKEEAEQEPVDDHNKRGDEDEEESKNDHGGSVHDVDDKDSNATKTIQVTTESTSQTTTEIPATRLILRETIPITIRMMTTMIMVGIIEAGTGVVAPEIGMGTEVGLEEMDMEDVDTAGAVATKGDKVQVDKEIIPLKCKHHRKLIDPLSFGY